MEIKGYYKRERDNTEYIFYIKDGIEHLTNGVKDWSNLDKKDKIQNYLKQTVKVENIDMSKMKERLKENLTYGDLTTYLTKENENG